MESVRQNIIWDLTLLANSSYGVYQALTNPVIFPNGQTEQLKLNTAAQNENENET